MADRDLIFCAGNIKKKQEEMQISFTGIIDALNSLKKENDYLRGIWKGTAGENFMSAYLKTWEEAKTAADELGDLIAFYTVIEKNFEAAENEIAKLDC